MNRRKLNEIYNLFDVMVLPTAGEGFGLPIVEAQAAGVPVIATACSACIELVSGHGELIAVKDSLTMGKHNIDYAIPDNEDLVSKLDLLYERRDLREHYGRCGREFAKKLDWRGIVETWDQLLTDIACSQ